MVWYDLRNTSQAPASYLRRDHQGSIIAVGDAAGLPIAINSYDEYGIPATNAQGAPLNQGRFQYTGQAWLSELGMYHYKARIYSPTLGRFLQVDPIGYDDQFNLYAYVGNDPVNASDPTGNRILYHGSRTEVVGLKAAVQRATEAHPELARRHESLEQSRYVHDVYPVGGILPRPEVIPIGPNADANAQNGIGTGTRIVISLQTMTLRGQGVGGDDVTASPATVATHELLSHGYETDLGIADSLGEIRAIGLENMVRPIFGEDPRLAHSPQEPCTLNEAGRCE